MHCKNGIRVVNSAGAVVLLVAKVVVAVDAAYVALAADKDVVVVDEFN